MKEKHENISKAVLSKAFEQTMQNFSEKYDLNSGNDVLNLSVEEYFEDTMANTQLMSENSKDKSTSYAETFALHSINLVAQNYEMQNSIDEFFTNPDNQDWLKENGVSDDEKAALRQEIKDLIADELKVKCNSKEETDFVEKVKAVFEGEKDEKSADRIKHSLDFISNVNKYIENNYNTKEALDAAYNDMSFLDGEHKITNVLSEGISTLSSSVDKEKIGEYMQDISASYVNVIDNKEVTPQSFSKNYQANPNALKPEENEWAHKVFGKMLYNAWDEKNGFNIENIDYTSFLANGEQIISNEERDNSKGANDIQAMEAKIAAKLAAGEKITVRQYAPEKSVNVNPSDVKLNGFEAMSHTMYENHYKENPGKLTAYDRQWAENAFDMMFANALDSKNKWTVANVDLSSFYANGKQIITSEEYESAKNEKGIIPPRKESEMKYKIAASLAAGDKITVRRSVPEKEIEASAVLNTAKKISEVSKSAAETAKQTSGKNAMKNDEPVVRNYYVNADSPEFDTIMRNNPNAKTVYVQSDAPQRNAMTNNANVRNAFVQSNIPQRNAMTNNANARNAFIQSNIPEKNTKTNNNTNAKDASAQTNAKSNETKSEKKETKKMPMTLEDFLYQLFVKILHSLENSLSASRANKEKGKKDVETAKSSRTKTSFKELLKEEPQSKKVSVNFKKTYEKSFGEKSKDKGKTM